jgi:hypothetical protein
MINANVPLLRDDPKSFIATFWYKFFASLAPGSKSIQVPLTGFSITIAAGVELIILNPAGVLATGTIVMPAGAGDGDRVKITSTQTITALTVSPSKGQTVKNAPTALTVSTTAPYGYEFVFDAASATWYRVQ